MRQRAGTRALPIDAVLPDLLVALTQAGRALLQARLARARPPACPGASCCWNRGGWWRAGRCGWTLRLDALAGAPVLVATDLDGAGCEARMRLALPVDMAELRDLHGDRIATREVRAWCASEAAPKLCATPRGR